MNTDVVVIPPITHVQDGDESAGALKTVQGTPDEGIGRSVAQAIQTVTTSCEERLTSLMAEVEAAKLDIKNHLTSLGSVGSSVDHAVGAADRVATAQIAKYKAAAAAAHQELQTSTTSLAAALAEVDTIKAREAAKSEAHAAIIQHIKESEEEHRANIEAIEGGLKSHRANHATELETLKSKFKLESEKQSKPLKAKLAAATATIAEMEAEAAKTKADTDAAQNKFELQIKTLKRQNRSDLDKEKERFSAGLGNAEAAETEIRYLRQQLADSQTAQGTAEQMVKAGQKKYKAERKQAKNTEDELRAEIEDLRQRLAQAEDPMIARMKKLQQANRMEKKKLASEKRKTIAT